MTEVRAELLADPASLEALTGPLAELLDLASLELDDAGVAGAPTEAEPQPAPETPETPESAEEIRALTGEQLAAADKLTAQAAALRKTAAAIDEKRESLAGLIDAGVASGAAFGAAVTGMDKADEASRQGLSTAVTALGDQEASPAGRFAAFRAAFEAVKASHDAVVAAEQAAAEQAAAEEARRQAGSSGGGSYNGGGSSGGGGGSYNGGGGSSGGGGGSAAPSPAPGQNWDHIDKAPAKFTTGANYVPYSWGDCSFYSSHQVGWGGTSTSGDSMGRLGAPWSATVYGDTVTYYIC